jgi:dipeptidyl aminopeptidase/acylaminoacyl peptidase
MNKSIVFLCVILTAGIGVISACESQRVIPTARPSDAIQATDIVSATVAATSSECSKSTIPPSLLPTRTVSKSNKLIAFVNSSNSYSGDGEADIHVMNLDGSNQKNISNYPGMDTNPIWSPDGKKVAYLSLRNSPLKAFCHGPSSECVPELFLSNFDGTGSRQITKGITYSPTWSPDSRQIAFIHYFRVYPSLFPLIPIGGHNERMLSNIYLVDASDANLHNLTNKPGIYDNVVWSPDGKRIAFILSWPSDGIGIINSDGTRLSIYPDFHAQEISWTPDGKNLVFIGSKDDIYKLSADFIQINKLTSTPDALKSMLTFSRDGKWLIYYFQDIKSLCGQIRALNMETLQDYFVYDEQDVQKLTEKSTGITFLPSSLGISSIDLSQDGTQLVFSQIIRFDGVIPETERIFTIDLDGKNLRQIDTSNAEYYDLYDAYSPTFQP